MTRIVFFGTPEEAVPTLRALHERFDVVLAVTQPDRPKGRSGIPQPPAVKVAAEDAGIMVSQPATPAELADVVLQGGFDLGVVVAYGRILRSEVLEAPQHGILNVHFSLLPRWRGAAPVARALIAGDSMSGVTIIKLDEGLDTGPVLTAQAVDIGVEENAGELTGRLAALGARLMVDTIPGFLSGDLTPVEQSDEGLTYADKIVASDRNLDGEGDAERFVARVRGLAPEPAARLTIEGEPYKVLSARIADVPSEQGKWILHDDWPVVAVGGSSVVLQTLQPPGKRPQSGDDWVRGRHKTRGEVG